MKVNLTLTIATITLAGDRIVKGRRWVSGLPVQWWQIPSSGSEKCLWLRELWEVGLRQIKICSPVLSGLARSPPSFPPPKRLICQKGR